MPDSLRRLIASALSDIEELGAEVAAGRMTADEWQADMARTLAEHHIGSYMAGQERGVLSAKGRRVMGEVIGEQIDFLNRFADQIAAEGWKPSYAARAAMYAGALKESWWRGRAGGLPLPGYPGDGSTTCLTQCRCFWELDTLDAEEDNIDAYWRLGDTEHCEGCVDRAARWAPYRIRGGKAA